MKTKNIAAIAAASSLMLMGSAWAHDWNSSQAASGSGYAAPGTTVFTGNTVSPIDHAMDTTGAQPVIQEQSTTVYTAPSDSSAAGSSGTSSSATPGYNCASGNSTPGYNCSDSTSTSGTSTAVGVTTNRIVGYTQTDQAPLDRADVHRQASEFARLRANASGEQPDYPARQQMFLGTAPGQEQQPR